METIAVYALTFALGLHWKTMFDRYCIKGAQCTWLETEEPRVPASPASLHCVLEQDTLIPP